MNILNLNKSNNYTGKSNFLTLIYLLLFSDIYQLLIHLYIKYSYMSIFGMKYILITLHNLMGEEFFFFFVCLMIRLYIFIACIYISRYVATGSRRMK